MTVEGWGAGKESEEGRCNEKMLSGFPQTTYHNTCTDQVATHVHTMNRTATKRCGLAARHTHARAHMNFDQEKKKEESSS